MLRQASYILIGLVLAVPSVAKAQSCSPQTIVSPTQSVGLLVTDGQGTCSVEDHGYIKANTVYNRHVSASITGVCQEQFSLFGACWNLPWTDPRILATTYLYVDATSVADVTSSPYGVQGYSTCVDPPSCTQQQNTLVTGASWYTTVLGSHVYTSYTETNSTPCSFQPASFDQDGAGGHSITMNALQCVPNFAFADPNNSPAIVHMPATDILIYTPLTGGGIADAIDNAATTWTSAIASTGIQVTRTTTDCGSAANCIHVVEGPYAGCAITTGDWDSTGEVTGNATVTLSSTKTVFAGNGWRYYGNALNYALVHELGHLFGLGDHMSDECSIDNSIMRTSIPTCDASSLPTAPTINNSLPSINTVYGGHTTASCGF